MAIPDNFQLTGQATTVGNDGPAETIQNPAYLSLPLSTNFYEISSDQWIAPLSSGQLSSVSGSSLTNNLQYSGNLAFTYHNLAGNWLHLSAMVGGDTKPTIANSTYSGGVSKPYASISTFTRDASAITVNQTNLSGALGIGLRASKLHRFGVSVSIASQSQTQSATIDVAGTTDAATNITANINLSSTQKDLLINPIIGYVYHQKDGDIGFVFKPYPVLQSTLSRNFDVNFVSGTNTITINESRSSTFSMLERPSFAAGFSQQFLPRLKLYGSADLGIPFSKSRGDNAITSTVVQEVNVVEKFKPSFSVSIGSAVKILQWLTAYGGLFMKKASSSVRTGNADQSYLQIKETFSTIWRGSVGVGFFNADPYYFYVGLGYFQLLQSEPTVTKTPTSTSGVGTQIKVQGMSINIGGRFVF